MSKVLRKYKQGLDLTRQELESLKISYSEKEKYVNSRLEKRYGQVITWSCYHCALNALYSETENVTITDDELDSQIRKRLKKRNKKEAYLTRQ